MRDDEASSGVLRRNPGPRLGDAAALGMVPMIQGVERRNPFIGGGLDLGLERVMRMRYERLRPF